MSHIEKLNPKIEMVRVGDKQRVPVLQLNGSAGILPTDKSLAIGDLIRSFDCGYGKAFRLPSAELLQTVTGGPDFPEDGLVKALLNKDSLNPSTEGLIDAEKVELVMFGRVFTAAMINDELTGIPHGLCIVYDHPETTQVKQA